MTEFFTAIKTVFATSKIAGVAVGGSALLAAPILPILLGAGLLGAAVAAAANSQSNTQS